MVRAVAAGIVSTMTMQWNDRRAARNACAPAPRLKVALLYEDPATAREGMRLHDRLVVELGHDYLFTLALWKFDVLGNPGVTAPAADETADANLIIVCTHNDDALPDGVKDWLERWSAVKTEAARAVVWLNNPSSDMLDSSQIAAFFADLARPNDVTLFTESDAGSPVAAQRLNLAAQPGLRFAIPSLSLKPTK